MGPYADISSFLALNQAPSLSFESVSNASDDWSIRDSLAELSSATDKYSKRGHSLFGGLTYSDRQQVSKVDDAMRSLQEAFTKVKRDAVNRRMFYRARTAMPDVKLPEHLQGAERRSSSGGAYAPLPKEWYMHATTKDRVVYSALKKAMDDIQSSVGSAVNFVSGDRKLRAACAHIKEVPWYHKSIFKGLLAKDSQAFDFLRANSYFPDDFMLKYVPKPKTNANLGSGSGTGVSSGQAKVSPILSDPLHIAGTLGKEVEQHDYLDPLVASGWVIQGLDKSESHNNIERVFASTSESEGYFCEQIINSIPGDNEKMEVAGDIVNDILPRFWRLSNERRAEFRRQGKVIPQAARISMVSGPKFQEAILGRLGFRPINVYSHFFDPYATDMAGNAKPDQHPTTTFPLWVHESGGALFPYRNEGAAAEFTALRRSLFARMVDGNNYGYQDDGSAHEALRWYYKYADKDGNVPEEFARYALPKPKLDKTHFPDDPNNPRWKRWREEEKRLVQHAYDEYAKKQGGNSVSPGESTRPKERPEVTSEAKKPSGKENIQKEADKTDEDRATKLDALLGKNKKS